MNEPAAMTFTGQAEPKPDGYYINFKFGPFRSEEEMMEFARAISFLTPNEIKAKLQPAGNKNE